MKHALIVIFTALMALASTAQTVELSDSTWITNTAGKFFQNRLISYLDGGATQTKTLLGDTTAVVSRYKTDFINLTGTWANDIEWTSTFTKKVTELIRQDQALTSNIGRSPVKSIVESYKWLPDSTFRIKDGTKQLSIRFTITNAGQLRYKIDTFATRNAILLGKVMRLQNYKNGSSIDLYQFQDDRWRDGTRTVQLYRESIGAQNRGAREAPIPSNFAEVAIDLPITYEGGLVHAYGQWLKYNATKKKWLEAKPPAGIKPQGL